MRSTLNLLLAISLCFFCTTLLLAQGKDVGEPTAASSVAVSDESQSAEDTVNEAAKILAQIKSDPKSAEVLRDVAAVFIVSDYGRASLRAGSGQGVLIKRQREGWSAPAFYTLSAINFGAVASAEIGSVAFLMLDGDGLKGFSDQHNFSLNSETGLTDKDDSERSQTALGNGADIVVWTPKQGIYGNFAASISDIFWDKEVNRAYYGRDVTLSGILSGSIKDPLNSAFDTAESK